MLLLSISVVQHIAQPRRLTQSEEHEANPCRDLEVHLACSHNLLSPCPPEQRVKPIGPGSILLRLLPVVRYTDC